ncbi:MAG: hypothetical protein IK015_08840 [Treponema sp.]|nr:hypothetical protein [Treponema sp.]
MLNLKTLRIILKEIFELDDEHIVPITANWFVPSVNLKEEDEIYLGYRIISKKQFSLKDDENAGPDFIKVYFRLSFLGRNSEQFAEQIYFWKDNDKVKNVFASFDLELNFNDISSFTYPISSSVKNGEMSWIFDMSAMSDYEKELKLITY